MKDIQYLYRRFQRARSVRSGWEAVWRDCYEYALPQRGSSFHPGESPIVPLFDGTAPDSVDQLAALILSEMTPPWLRWFQLTAGTDLSEAERNRIAVDLEKISDILQTHFDRSNFAMEIHQCYFDLITAGTACLLFEEAPVGLATAFRFTAIPLSEIYVLEGPSGRLDTTFRLCRMDLETFRNRFPTVALPEKVYQENREIYFNVIEAIIPNPRGGYDYTAFLQPDSQYDSLNGMNPVLKEGYYRSSPFITFRWLKAPGEVYGRSPVMKTLPDIKTANKVVELILKNASISVTGIWLAEDDGVLNPGNISLVPGAIIPKAVGSKGLTPLEAPGKFDVSQLMIDDLRKRIRHALLVDRFGEVDTPKMTATEVLQRSDEMMRILGATYGRLQTELLTPLIERAVYILRKRGEIPEIYLDGRLLKVAYKSTRAGQQAQIDANNALLWLSSVSKLGDSALQSVDIAAFVKWLGQQLNVPADILGGHSVTNGAAV
ncbi:MAG: head-tail connector protein [Alphaproteobacteria bacterium]|nr:head-tail connector protein [Alphaproteobacteria bacterium]